MRRYIGLSTLALATAMLAGGAAYGQGLSVGGVSVGGSDGGASVSVGGNSGASVSVGGDGASGSSDSTVSVDLGGSSSNEPAVGVSLGGNGGNTGGSGRTLLNLGGNGATGTGVLGGDDDANVTLFGDGSPDATVDVDDDSAVSADILDDGSDGALGIEGLFGDGGTNDDAVLLDLFGPDDDSSVAAVDLSGNTNDPNDVTAGLGGESPDATVDIFGEQNGTMDTAGLTRGADAIVDLSGSNDDPNDVTATLNGDNGNPSDVIVDLFGSGQTTDLSGDNAAVDLSGGADDPNDVTADLGGNAPRATVDVFGNGATNSGGNVTAGLPGVGSDGSVIIDLGGATETSTGNGDGSGDTGGNGGGTGGNGGGTGGSGGNTANNDDPNVGGGANSGSVGGGLTVNPNGGQSAPRPAVRVAAVDNKADSSKCFTPNETQIEFLLKSRSYDTAMMKSWASADDVNLVPVRLCPEARVKVEQAVEVSPSIQWLQDAVEKDAQISAELGTAGLDGENVLALENKDDEVQVYVY